MCGFLIIMVMRMLAEMAVANPSTGSFADYARNALGGWAGFSMGWLYWYFWVIIVGFEAIAGAKIAAAESHDPKRAVARPRTRSSCASPFSTWDPFSCS